MVTYKQYAQFSNLLQLPWPTGLGALYVNTKEAKLLLLTVFKHGYPQLPTQINVDNTNAVVIAHNSTNKSKPKAMEIRYFWLRDQDTYKYFKKYYLPGQEC